MAGNAPYEVNVEGTDDESFQFMLSLGTTDGTVFPLADYTVEYVVNGQLLTVGNGISIDYVLGAVTISRPRGFLAASDEDYSHAMRVRHIASSVEQMVFSGVVRIAEGKALVVCAEPDADAVLEVLRAHPLGRDAARIGRVLEAPRGIVLLATSIGGERVVNMPAGEELPRIC